MRIEDILNITNGVLVNTPFIEAIDSYTSYISKVEKKSLFFAFQKDQIPKAVQNGAYAIIYEGDTKILDKEIAWIKVESLKDAALKFLRFKLLNKNIKTFLFKAQELSIFKMIATNVPKEIYSLSNNFQKDFEAILNGKVKVIIGDNELLIKSISPNFSILNKMAKGEIISSTLLKSTFFIENLFYKDKELSPIHFKKLQKVVYFLNNNNISYKVENIRYLKEFRPYFVDNQLNPLLRGGSSKILIFAKYIKDIKSSIDYLQNSKGWNRYLTISKENIELNNLYILKDIDKIVSFLKKSSFNYAFLYKIEPEEIFNKKDSSSLF